MFPGNCYSERPYLADIAKSMNQAHSMIGIAEELLYPGQRPLAQVGILFPRSSFVWDTVAVEGELQNLENLTEHVSDYAAEVYGLYLALNVHANIHVDILDEDMASTQEALSPLKLLIITQPNVPAEVMSSVSRWAKAGGTILTTSGAAKADRLNDTTAVLRTLTGIEEAPRQRLNINYATSDYCCCPPCPDRKQSSWPIAAKGSINWPAPTPVAGDFDAIGIRSYTTAASVSRATTPTVLGSFADGSAAVLRTNVGKGAAVHFNFLPGLSYLPNATNWQRLPLPSEFPHTLRATLVAAAINAGVELLVRCSSEFVETPLLVGSAGAVLTVLNWRDSSSANFTAESSLQINMTLPFEPKTVESVSHGSGVIAARQLAFAVLRHDSTTTTIGVNLVNLSAAAFVLVWKDGRTTKTDDGAASLRTSETAFEKADDVDKFETNLVKNPDFTQRNQNESAHWKGVYGSFTLCTNTTLPGSTVSLEWHNSNPHAKHQAVTQKIDPVPGKLYTMSAYVRTGNISGSSGYATVEAVWKKPGGGWGGKYPSGFGSTHNWSRVQTEFLYPAGASDFSIVLTVRPLRHTATVQPTGWAWWNAISLAPFAPRDPNSNLLINSNFSQRAPDGSPLGWHGVDGEIFSRCTSTAVAEDRCHPVDTLVSCDGGVRVKYM